MQVSMGQYVYHSSPTGGLKILEPQSSTHGESWVYATKDKLMSAVFLGREGGDYTCQVGRDHTGKIFITERFKGAFDVRYKTSGSIYTLKNTGFLENKTSWSEEVVSPKATKIVKEEYVEDARGYLKTLEEQGKIKISYYPERYMVDKNDGDLISKARMWVHQFGIKEIEIFARYHPKLAKDLKTDLEKENK